MQRAGQAACTLLQGKWPQARRICVLTGIGNNGGDGFEIARLAAAAGLDVTVLQLGDPARITGDAYQMAEQWRASGGRWAPFTELPRGVDVIVDALLGTGLERDVGGQWREAIHRINEQRAPVLAIDIPSGLHADRGVVMGAAVRASATISFIGLKQGMFTADGPEYCGEIHFDALAVPARIYASQILAARRLDIGRLRGALTPRARNAHKGHFGHVLVLGGDRGMGGAARMAVEASARVGAGLVSLATHPDNVSAVLAARPEAMVLGVRDAADLAPLLVPATVVVVGPGLGQSEWGRALWRAALAAQRPLVVDADALNLLALTPCRRDDWVLTPHPGEAARLLGVSNAEIQADRFAAVDALVRRYGGVWVLKGAGTLIRGGGDQPPGVCSAGNPGMASGGMGDVLSGVIGGLLAQGQALGLGLREVAELGVCIHAAAGDLAAAEAGERGMLATDLMPYIRRLVNPT